MHNTKWKCRLVFIFAALQHFGGSLVTLGLVCGLKVSQVTLMMMHQHFIKNKKQKTNQKK